MAGDFLHCRLETLPFKYLGLPVGDILSREVTWDPLVNLLAKRLNSWKRRFVSLGGRVVLLNSVFNAIHIFFLSYLKMPVKFGGKLFGIQRRFQLGGVKGDSKISWVS